MSSAADALIEVRDLKKTLGDREVLQGLDFTVKPGEIVGYLGPNGAGKSTTMKILTGQWKPSGGSVRVLGLDVPSHVMEVRRRIAYVPEVAPVYEVLTAMEQLELVGRLRGLDSDLVARRAGALLESLDLGEVRHRPLWTYSRGMKQRVILASAFLHEPELILLDEPLYGLDVQTVLLVKEIIRRLADRGLAIV